MKKLKITLDGEVILNAELSEHAEEILRNKPLKDIQVICVVQIQNGHFTKDSTEALDAFFHSHGVEAIIFHEVHCAELDL